MGPYRRDTTLILGHRGASAHAADNTLEAYRLALQHGADGVELDVRRTADGAMVLHHDPVVDGIGTLVELTLAEIRDRTDVIPTLDEAGDVLGTAVINIEIKNSPLEADFDPGHSLAPLVTAWVSARGLHHSVIVSSFNPDTVAAVRAADPTVATALLSSGLDLPSLIPFAAAAGFDALHPDAETLSAAGAEHMVNLAAERGLHVATWTVDDVVVATSLRRAGVAAIITNDPADLTGNRAGSTG